MLPALFNCLEPCISKMISKQSRMLMRQCLTMTSERMGLYMMAVLLMIGADFSTHTCMASLLRTAFSCTPLMSSTARPTWRREKKWLSTSKKFYGEASKRSLRSNDDPVLQVHYFMYMGGSHKDWELPNSRIWLAEIEIKRGLDFLI